MDWRLKKQGNNPYLCRNIRIEHFFSNSFMENSVQFNVIEIQQKEGKARVASSTFCHEMAQNEERFEMGVSGDGPLLKFHFSLEGAYTYVSEKAGETSILLPEGIAICIISPILRGRS